MMNLSPNMEQNVMVSVQFDTSAVQCGPDVNWRWQRH